MDIYNDINDIKRHVIEYVEQSHKHVELSLVQIVNEVNKLKNENEMLLSKCKKFFNKIEPIQIHENLNGTFLSDVSQLSTIKKEHSPIKTRYSNAASKINIQNLVINKKVQISKNFSKLRINTITNTNSNIIPTKHNYTTNQHSNNKSTSPNTSFSNNNNNNNNSSSSKYRIKTPNRIRIDTKPKTKLNKANYTTHNNNNNNSSSNCNSNTNIIKPKRILPNNIKKTNSINDIRKLSIVDIPFINGIIPNTQHHIDSNTFIINKKRDNSIDYLYSNKQKAFLILAKSDILPIHLRTLFVEQIQFVYNYTNLKNDCLLFHLKQEKELALMKKEFIMFTVSTTIQALFNFISKENEISFHNEYTSLPTSSNDKYVLNTLFTIIEMVFNYKGIVNNTHSIKETLLKLLSHKRLQITYTQVHALHLMIKEHSDILSDTYLGVLSQKNKIHTLLLLIVREVYLYSMIRFNNTDKTPMICFDAYINTLNEYKNEIEKIMN